MAEPSLEKRFRAFVDRLQKFEHDAGAVTPAQHEVSQLLHDLWGKRREVEQHLEAGDIARARRAEAILHEMEYRLEAARKRLNK